MKLAFLTISLLFSALSYSQSLQKIDASNGFKDFHLGDSKSKWTPYLTKKTGKPDGYLYTGSCCKTAFGIPVEEIVLLFDDAQTINTIAIMLSGTFGDGAWLNIRKTLTAEFGKETSFEMLDADTRAYHWATNTRALTMMCFYKHDIGAWQVCLYFTEVSVFENKKSDY